MKYNSPLLAETDSVASIESGDTVRPEFLADGDQRWSELVPPDACLTFGLAPNGLDSDAISFSTSPDVLLSPPARRRPVSAPSDANASTLNRSRIITLDAASDAGFASEYTCTPGTLEYLRDNFPGFELPSLEPRQTSNDGTGLKLEGVGVRGTQTSSTFDGMDVYLPGSLLSKPHNTNRYASCFEEAEGQVAPALDPAKVGDVEAWMRAVNVGDVQLVDEDEYMKDVWGNPDNLPSRFTTTTTSTSTWMPLEAPNTPGYTRLVFNQPAQRTAGPLHTQVKEPPKSPEKTPVLAEDVLKRSGYNHRLRFPITRAATSPSLPAAASRPFLHTRNTATATSPNSAGSPVAQRVRNLSARTLSLPGLPKLGRLKKRAGSADAPGWVWIDVKDREKLEEAEDEGDETDDFDPPEERVPIWQQYSKTLLPTAPTTATI